jgi:hypothetical protein
VWTDRTEGLPHAPTYCSARRSRGVSDFDGPRSGKYNEEVRLYAFDILALDGDDLRKLPLSIRKQHPARLLKLRPNGIFVAPFEQGEIGPDLFMAACNMGLDPRTSNDLIEQNISA